MAKSAGVITINVNAGTAQLVQDLDKAKAKVADFTNQGVRGFQQFGAHSVSSMQATSGALRDLQGNFTNNIRASERFIATTLGLGPVLQAAFPLIGGLAFGGMLVEMGTKVYEFFKSMSDAPEKIGAAFREVNAPIRSTTDALHVANDRLQMDIDKLQGRRTNTLALTMDEARASVDKLFDSVEKTFGAVGKLLQANATTFVQRMISGAASSDKDLLKLMVGESGAGGIGLDLAKQIQKTNAEIDEAIAAKDPTALAKARAEGIKTAGDIISNALIQVNSQIAAQELLKPSGKKSPHGVQMMDIVPRDAAQMERLQGTRLSLMQVQSQIPVMLSNADLTAKKEQLTSANENAKMDRPFEDRIKAMKAQLEDLKGKLASVGHDDAFRAVTEGHASAIKDIELVNKALENMHQQLISTKSVSGKFVDPRASQVEGIAIQIKQTEIETAYQTKLDSTTRSIQDRITAAQALTAAIGRGYEAVKAATVETQLATAMGREYNDSARSADQAALRSKLSAEFEARHRQEITQTLDKLGDQIELEKSLSAVQYQGAEAVRQAELAYRLDQIAKSNDAESTKKLQAAEKELYAATQANHSAATVAKIADETAALKRLTVAAVEGAEAVRKAGSANQFAELSKKGGSPVPGMIGVSQEQIASAGQEQAQHEKEITDTAFHRVNIYKDQLESLNQQLSVLKDYEAKNGDNLQIDIAIRDIENEKLNLLAQQYLATGKLSDGLKAFFLESAANAKKPGQILHDGLDHAVDGVADELSKMMTGQKFDFGKMMQQVGQGMLKDSLKSGMQQGIGALGKALHIPGLDKLGAKADPVTFRSGDAGHVLVDNWPGDGSSVKNLIDRTGPTPTIASTILGYIAPVAGGVAGVAASGGGGGGGGGVATSDTSIAFGGEAPSPRAAGGPVSPDQAYWVGEHGPEPFVPRTSGTIIPAGKLGSGDSHYHVTVNAPNSDLGAAGRIKQMVPHIIQASVALSNKVMQERAQRVPR